jgi:hypothetical protein
LDGLTDGKGAVGAWVLLGSIVVSRDYETTDIKNVLFLNILFWTRVFDNILVLRRHRKINDPFGIEFIA